MNLISVNNDVYTDSEIYSVYNLTDDNSEKKEINKYYKIINDFE